VKQLEYHDEFDDARFSQKKRAILEKCTEIDMAKLVEFTSKTIRTYIKNKGRENKQMTDSHQ
jgi:hypothetical protein